MGCRTSQAALHASPSSSIHTFGFGYSLLSGLLKSIAEIGGGDLDCLFFHAVANLQSTFATNAMLELSFFHPL